MLYMDPSMLMGKSYTYSADLWALGVFLYYIMTGKYPFGEDLLA
jgi:serine/threonine protein kinase